MTNIAYVDTRYLGGTITGPALMNSSPEVKIYFGGKLVAGGSYTDSQNSVLTPVVLDRLGSGAKTFPYGEERAPNGVDGIKFATYTRETATNLDYALNRYYANQWGRFTTPDPYVASGGVGDPGSWNRYAYARGDAINRMDPGGTSDCPAPCFSVTHTEFAVTGETSSTESGFALLLSGRGRDADPNIMSDSGLDTHEGMPAWIVPAALDPFAFLSAAEMVAEQALRIPDCRGLFGNMKDPRTGKPLDPTVVLKSLSLAAQGKGDGGYGTIRFLDLGDNGQYGSTSGYDLHLSRSGPYFSSAVITINTTYWNMGYASLNATALLHELGHVMNTVSAGFFSRNGFVQYDNSGSDNTFNTHLIEDNCIRKLGP